jgi:hypothetical protein
LYPEAGDAPAATDVEQQQQQRLLQEACRTALTVTDCMQSSAAAERFSSVPFSQLLGVYPRVAMLCARAGNLPAAEQVGSEMLNLPALDVSFFVAIARHLAGKHG